MLKRDWAPAKMSPRMPRLLAERAQDVDVVVGEVGAGLAARAARSSRASRLPCLRRQLVEVDAALVGHLQEEQVGDLLDVVAVVDAVMAKGVAEAPEFLDDVGHAAMASLSSSRSAASLPSKTRLARPQPPCVGRRRDMSRSPPGRSRGSATRCSRMRSSHCLLVVGEGLAG